jgi:anti-sigma regulatory factor (Ser/Thr protein kinase)
MDDLGPDVDHHGVMADADCDLATVDGHVVQFYERDDELVAAVTAFAASGLAAGERVLVVATAAHRAAVADALRHKGCGLEGYVELDAAATLDRFLDDDGRVDRARYFDVIGALVADLSAASGGRPLRIFGEMVAVLWERDLVAEAMVLEELWNELGSRGAPFTLMCGYRSSALQTVDDADRFFDACSHHGGVVRDAGASVELWRRFDGEHRSLAPVRAFVDAALERWECTELAPEAAVVVSELATNAILHARATVFDVSVGLTTVGVRISVHDRSPVEPAARRYASHAAGGRGLHLVGALSAQWGVDRLPSRKTVWAELGRAAV